MKGRFTKEFKVECVKKYQQSIPIEVPNGWKKDNFYHEVRIWEKMYKKFGDKVFDENKPKLSYTKIINACKRIINGESLKSVSISLGRNKTTIRNYFRVYLQDGSAGIKLILQKGKHNKYMDKIKIRKPETKNEIIENESLKNQVQLLTIENEYLKKLAALVQKRKAQQQKKK